MKSAYELAMERFDNDSSNQDIKPLNDAQKIEIENINKKFKAKIAERELFLSSKIAESRSVGDRNEEEAIRRQLGSERIRLEEESEFEKNKIRSRA